MTLVQASLFVLTSLHCFFFMQFLNNQGYLVSITNQNDIQVESSVVLKDVSSSF